MKIYNTDNTTSSCPTTNTVISTGTSIPTLTNVAIIPDNTQTCNIACTERCQNLGRFRTLGVANIDPKQSYVCGSTTLKVCGNLEVCDNLIVNGNLIVVGATIINVVNLTVTGNLVACDISACNLDLSQNLTVAGDTTLVDVSATNIDITQNVNIGGDLDVTGHTQLVDVSANIIQYKNNSQFFNWGVHIIPEDGRTFELGLISRISGAPPSLTITNVEITWNRNEQGGWIYPGYGSYGVIGNHHPPNSTWSDRGSYPTDGFENTAGDYSYAIGLTIPFDGEISRAFSRFSWTLGRYAPAAGIPPAPPPFTLNMEVYIIRCGQNFPAAPERVARMQIVRKCGHGVWGVLANGIVWTQGPDVTVSAGDALGLFITSNQGNVHSPATFTLEIQRDI